MNAMKDFDRVFVEFVELDGVDGDAHQARLRTIWSFNVSGTRAACVVGHRDDPWSDAHYTSSRYSSAGVYQHDCHEDYPGVVEVDFYFDRSFVVVLCLLLFLYNSEGFAFLICPYFLFVICW